MVRSRIIYSHGLANHIHCRHFVPFKFGPCFRCTWVLFVCYFFIVLSKCNWISFHDCSVDSSSPCPIYLTISPISQNVDNSFLEINWGPKCSNPAEWIGLYAEDPSVSHVAPLFTANSDNKTTGHIKTNVKLGKIDLPYGWNRNEAIQKSPDFIKLACLPFYIASFNGKTIQTLDCLKIQPNWMQSMPQIQEIPVRNLFIPGTHCSGCYDRRSKISRSILLKKFGFLQNFDIWTQLVFGIRYLDISVGCVCSFNEDFIIRVKKIYFLYKFNRFKETSNASSNFWIVNENLFVMPLLPILKEIRLFATLSKEVVIVNFVDFPIGTLAFQLIFGFFETLKLSKNHSHNLMHIFDRFSP